MCRDAAHARAYICRVNAKLSKIPPEMNQNLVISDHVRNTINALPAKEREAVSNAINSEFILGVDPTETLTPYENILYAMISFYVRRDNAVMA